MDQALFAPRDFVDLSHNSIVLRDKAHFICLLQYLVLAQSKRIGDFEKDVDTVV